LQILHRHLAIPLHRAMQEHAIVAVTGPRGAGKSTLARREFPGHAYLTLEDAVARRRVRQDPKAFLGSFRGPAIVDEAHRAPELLDALPEYSRTGQLLLLAPVRLNLAVELILYPLSTAEREQRPARPLDVMARYPQPKLPPARVPRIPHPAHKDFQALAQDASTRIALRDMDNFLAFAEKTLARSGHVLDQSELARQAGVTHTTIARWLAALQHLYRIVLLPPVEEDYGRRLVRRKKLYALDAAWVPEPHRFTVSCIADVLSGGATGLRHWQTTTGLETGLVVTGGGAPIAISFTPLPVVPASLSNALAKWRRLDAAHAAVLVHNGSVQTEIDGVRVYPWWWL
jgi:predicted AAA+ superfamily ATPase